MIRTSTTSLFVAFALTGCSSRGLLEEPWCSALASDPVETATDTPNYHRDIAPILETRCIGCHAAGGPGGYDLTRSEVALALAPLIQHKVVAREMPPWPPEQCCTSYKYSRALPAEERATIDRWAKAGAPAGDLSQRPPITPPEMIGLSRVDRTLTMPEPYTPKVSTGLLNEQRCFLIDWPSDQEEYVTGVNVKPERVELVHHVIVYVADEEQSEHFRSLDAMDDGPGWDCYGGVGNRVTAGLGGWAPGFFGVDFPAGTGQKVEPGSKIVLEVHYHAHEGSSVAADQTRVDLSIAPSVEKTAETVLVVHPQWLVGDGMRIRAGEKDAAWAFKYDPTSYYDGDALTFYNITLHMHALGTRGRVSIERADGSSECLIEVARWDYNWQGEYWFEEPKILRAGDRIYLECHWDNSAPGARDLAWGTDGEMCMATLYAVPGAP